MAKKKAGGKTTQHVSPEGKKLGVKVTTGSRVKPGTILIRQRGQVFHKGTGTKIGRDHTIYSVALGTVKFDQKLGKRIVSVLSE
ncbi:50S ribosomal protein L27 [Candidatus Woesebacteria bacterium]|nr:50S ribosomal protein L27 [Candidatus Woesebacteria bacterium]